MPREHAAWLGCLPVLATMLYYVLPSSMQQHLGVIFLPQLFAYAALAAWLIQNDQPWQRLRLTSEGLRISLRQGAVVGLALGAVNLSVILLVIPGLGGDIRFLRETPHALAPTWAMFPIGILIIAILVELNFRGFQMGRLMAIVGSSKVGQAVAVVLSAMVFAWDPFMVHVFQPLHWIALWDGLVWGMLFLRTASLYATITAHAVEVWILYISLKLWFS